MKRGLKAICVGLCAALMMGAFPQAAFAEEPDSSVIKGSFKTDGVEEMYFYSDEYFANASSVENMHLNTMSLVMALTIGSKDIGRIFDETGFTGIEYGEMDIEPTRDTIGTAIARKRIGSQDVVAVAVRGTHYKNEWASNFIDGDSGDAKGFDTASKTVNERIKKYISDNSLSDVKIWITGYSRAGGIACLTGAYINEHPAEFSTKAEDVYVYAFEAALATTSEKKYDNIWCMRNKNDIVNYVYPQGWGFTSNGHDRWIGEDKTIKGKKFDLGAEGYFSDANEVKMDDFIKELTDFVADGMPRENYSGDCEAAVSTVVDLWNSKSAEDRDKIKQFVKNDVRLAITGDTNNMAMLLNDINNGIMKHENDKMYQKFTKDIIKILDQAAEGGNMPLSEDEYNAFKACLYPIIRQVGPVFVRDYIYREGKDYSTAFPESHFDPDYDPAKDPVFALSESDESTILSYEINAQKAPIWRLYHIATVLKNVGEIANEHYGHTVFDMVKTYDSYYPEYIERKSKGLLGDVNGDDTIDIEDAVMVIGHVNGQKALTDEESARADIDGNSDIDIEDAVAIIAHVNGVKSIA